MNGRTQTHYAWETLERPADREPAVWQHDLYRKDRTPYDAREIQLLRGLATTLRTT